MEIKRQKRDLKETVLNFIRTHGLVENGQTVLVAVSGGPDSVCLLRMLNEAQKELGIKLHVAHLNHQLRGTDSDEDARYVSDLARTMNVPATIEKRDVAGYRREHGLSLEEAAREVRYAFLAETARSVGASSVAVGHTASDHVETILLHIIRGTGTQGLRGLLPVVRWHFSGIGLTIVRPLLELKREETAEYCSINQLGPRCDSSNLSPSLLRNRVRHELLPLLAGYNHGINETLSRTGRIAAEEADFMNLQGQEHWNKIVKSQDKLIIIEKAVFLHLPPALQRHILRRAMEDLLGTLKDIEARHIEEILNLAEKPAGRKVDLPENLTFSVEYDRYLLGWDLEKLPPFPELGGSARLNIPGRSEVSGWEIESSIRDPKPETEWNEDGFTACFDMDKTGGSIEMRKRHPGDWFQPLGMNQTKKVGQFMLDAKIPRDWRDRVPILVTPEQVIWVAGHRIDDRVRVTSETQRILCVQMSRKRA
jgi:tRNA(Ile)-lysidine synthase